MPFVPFVRVSNVDRAIALAKESEHGFGHTAILHSRDTSVMSKMGKIMDCTIFVVNGPCMAGLGLGGEGVPVVLDRRPDRRGRHHPADLLPPAAHSIVGGMRLCEKHSVLYLRGRSCSSGAWWARRHRP